jgi:FtsP/CotA-like multicopper oxidase with cupredoxin domain
VFSLNGQRFPTITLNAKGEIWRMVNTSGSVSYDLALTDRTNNRDLVMQVLAVDGVAVSVPTTVTAANTTTIAGKKFHLVTCPTDVAAHTVAGAPAPLCADRLIMMPSSRVEVYVAYRDASGKLATPAAGTNVVLQTKGRDMGPTGDTWPTIDLASVNVSKYAAVAANWQTIPISLADPKMLALSTALFASNQKVGVNPTCQPLAPGHRRRIFFNTPPNDPDGFGLGYEEVDAKGVPVPGTFKDVARFDPTVDGICVPLGQANGATHERWEIVNLAGEDHNFHIHQLKFSVVGTDTVSGGTLPTTAVQHDNVPLQHTLGSCNTVDDWRNGVCTAYPVVVDIPFVVAGDYVYHCHILEHEDGGMMARIRVRPSV